MLRFAEVWPDGEPVASLAERLSWSHLKEILYLKDDWQRLFYAEMCRCEAWSVRTLRNRIQGMLFERTVISRKPEALINQDIEKLRSDDQDEP